jgi:glycosyltransferase XagB
MLRKITSSRHLQFAAVGLAIMAFGFLILYLMVEIADISPRYAKPVELAISIQLNYIGNRVLTWRDRRIKSEWHGVMRSNIVRIAAAVAAWGIFVALTELVGVPYLWASLMSIVLTVPATYLLSHLWVYRDRAVIETWTRWPLRPRLIKLARYGAGLFVLAQLWLWLGTNWMIYLSVLIIIGLMTFVAASSCWLSLHAWHTPENLENVGFGIPQEPREGFSIIVPVRGSTREIIGPTLDALVTQNHPDFEILLVVSGDDDEETRRDAEAIARAHRDLIRMIYVTGEKNKPRALQAALPFTTKSVVGIIDAESITAPGLLINIDTVFQSTQADIVQGGVQLMNYGDSWWALLNCIEYYRWFKSRLHWHALQRFITLGGNTVFMRRSAIEAVGGWDVLNLTEDAEIGVRLSVAGFNVAVVYDPKFATRESTPDTVRRLVRQRRRWMQGFLQTYRKGEWRQLESPGKRMLARYTLLMPSAQALFGLMLPISIALALWVKIPTLLAMATFVPLAASLVTLAADLVALCEFGTDFDRKITFKHRVWLLVGTPFYQCLLSAAAVGAAWRHLRGVNVWDLTVQAGQHIQGTQVPATVRRSA